MIKIITLLKRLQSSDLQLIQPTVTNEEVHISQTPSLEDKTVEELLDMDPDMFPVIIVKKVLYPTSSSHRAIRAQSLSHTSNMITNGGSQLAPNADYLHLRPPLDIAAHGVAVQK